MSDRTNRLGPLLQPLTIRGLTLENRFVMAPMTREMADDRGPGQNMADYYDRRAKNNVGLIITEGIGIDEPAAVDTANIPHLHGDAVIKAWTKVVNQVHCSGGKIIPQLWHQGAMRDAAISPNPDILPLRPSGIIGPIGKISLEAEKIKRLSIPGPVMSEEKIADVISAYARSAETAKAIGFDGIALHGGHGYLIDNFLWHGTNTRTDKWGGSRAKRAEFAAELVRAIRRAIGPDLPIIFRFSQFKMQDYMAKLAETPAQLGELLEPIAEAGVDVFDGSQRYFDTPIFEESSLNLGGWAKKLTGKMGMCVGGVGLDKGGRDHHTDSGSAATDNLGRVVDRFKNGEFDLVGVGRSLLNDPAWVQKAINGESFNIFDNANLTRLT